jgi:hypothetical protein
MIISCRLIFAGGIAGPVGMIISINEYELIQKANYDKK